METVTRATKDEFQIMLPSNLSGNNLNSLTEKINVGLSVGERKTLIKVVSEFGKKENLKVLLSHIANDKHLLNRVIEKSYRHHNGFHKIVLMNEQNFKLRLHLFRPIAELPIPMENIHNHRWNFASQILNGKLCMELFKESNNGELQMNNYIYTTKGVSDEYNVECIGKIQLKKLSTISYETGCTYYMKSQELHRIINPDNVETCTLMMTGLPLSEKCKLFSRFEFKEEKQEVLMYSKSEILNLFQSVTKG